MTVRTHRKRIQEAETQAEALKLNDLLFSREHVNAGTTANPDGSRLLVQETKGIAAEMVRRLFDPNHKVKVWKLTADQMNMPFEDQPTIPDRPLTPSEAAVTEGDLAEMERLPDPVKARLKTVLSIPRPA